MQKERIILSSLYEANIIPVPLRLLVVSHSSESFPHCQIIEEFIHVFPSICMVSLYLYIYISDLFGIYLGIYCK